MPENVYIYVVLLSVVFAIIFLFSIIFVFAILFLLSELTSLKYIIGQDKNHLQDCSLILFQIFYCYLIKWIPI